MANLAIISNIDREMDASDKPILDILESIGNFLDEAGRFAEVFAFRAFPLNQMNRLHGEEDLDTICAMASLATALWNQGKLEKAASMEKEVLEKRRRILVEASMKKEALEKRKRILGEQHPDTISANSNLEIMLKAK